MSDRPTHCAICHLPLRKLRFYVKIGRPGYESLLNVVVDRDCALKLALEIKNAPIMKRSHA